MMSPKLTEAERAKFLPMLEAAGWVIIPERDAIQKNF